jgi:hypothetical protein
MKIDPTAPRSAAGVRRTGGGGSVGGFAKVLGSGSTPTSATAGTSPLGSVNAVLSLQEVDDPLVGRGRARKRGEMILDRLEEIRMGLLVGRIPRGRLEELTLMVQAEREHCDDERLNAVLDDIELRAAVELAKLDTA